MGGAFSYLLRQKIDDASSSHGNFSSPGITNARANIKAKLFHHGLGGLALSFNGSRNFVKKNPYLGNDEAIIFGSEIIADLDLGPFRQLST